MAVAKAELALLHRTPGTGPLSFELVQSGQLCTHVCFTTLHVDLLRLFCVSKLPCSKALIGISVCSPPAVDCRRCLLPAAYYSRTV